jgi:DNA-binding transcriptional ArsR family regulator
MESMPDSQTPNLDAVFAALADPTRRAILIRLQTGEASVTELARPFAISQPAVSKHLAMLERAGLIRRGVDRSRRPARLNAAPMADAVAFLTDFRQFWTARLDAMAELLADLQSPAPRDPDHD